MPFSSSTPAPRDFDDIDEGGDYQRVINGSERGLKAGGVPVIEIDEVRSGVRNCLFPPDFDLDDGDTSPGMAPFCDEVDYADDETLVMNNDFADTLVADLASNAGEDFDLNDPELAED